MDMRPNSINNYHYLGHYSILKGTEKILDLQVLLDLLQDQFDHPAGYMDGGMVLAASLRLLVRKTKCFPAPASTSGLYEKVQEIPRTEKTPFYPRSTYAVIKLYAYWVTINYREVYGIYACNGILFNHECLIRRKTFVARKITRAFACIKLGLQECIYLCNLDAPQRYEFEA